jgi:hypothetical protein
MCIKKHAFIWSSDSIRVSGRRSPEATIIGTRTSDNTDFVFHSCIDHSAEFLHHDLSSGVVGNLLSRKQEVLNISSVTQFCESH